MKRFRLTTLFVVTAIVALLVASWTSHSRARSEVQRLDFEVEAALQELVPLVSDRLKINSGREEFPPLRPYSYAGNSVGTALGGIIDGPSIIDRNVVVADGVKLTIECTSDWGIISGDAYVLIHQHDGHDNEWFIGRLKQILEERGVTIKNGG